MSSRTDTSCLKMRLLEKRPAALRVTGSDRAPFEGGPAVFSHWIPRSLVAYCRIAPSPVAGELPVIIFTLPDWKVDALNLWDFETREK